MITYDLDKTPDFTTDELKYFIDLVSSGKLDNTKEFRGNNNLLFKLQIIAGVLCYMTDLGLIQGVFNCLRKHGFLKEADHKLDELYNVLPITESYDVKDLIRIKAIFYHCFFLYEYQHRFYKGITRDSFPLAEFQVEGRHVLVNLDYTADILKSASRKFLIDYIKEIPSVEGQKVEYNIVIHSMAMVNSDHSTNTFDFDIKTLETLRDTTTEVRHSKLPYPFTKVGVYEMFDKYVTQNLTYDNLNSRREYGFLKKQLQKSRLIFNDVTDKWFMSWLKDDGYITSDEFFEIQNKGSKIEFDSYSSFGSDTDRHKNFNKIFSDLL